VNQKSSPSPRPSPDDRLVTASEIADLAGVGLSAVSNWRSRHRRTFPPAVARDPSGSDLYRLGEVQAWLEHRPSVRTSQTNVERDAKPASVASRTSGLAPPGESIDIGTAFLALLALPDEIARLLRHPDDPVTLGREVTERARALDAERPAPDRLFVSLTGADMQLAGEIAAPLLREVNEGTDLAELFEELLKEREQARIDRSTESRSTPSVARLLVAIAGANRGTVFDPAAGEGGFLLAAAEVAREARSQPPRLIGHETDPDVLRTARQRFLVHGLPVDGLLERDSLLGHAFDDVGADSVLCDPPYGMSLRGVDLPPFDDRWLFGLPDTANLDLAWVELSIRALRPEGRGCILLPNGSLFRGGQDARIRLELLRANAIEAIITLPPGSATSSAIPIAIWVVRPPHDYARGRVLLVDATEGHPNSRGSRPARPRGRELPRDLVGAILATVSEWRANPDGFRAVPGFAAGVSAAELIGAKGEPVPARWVRTTDALDSDELIARIEQAARAVASAHASYAKLPPLALTLAPGSGVPERVRIAELLATRDVELQRGQYSWDDAAARDQGIRVIGPWDFRGEGPRYVDAFDFKLDYLTQPWDIVLDPRRPGSVYLDRSGGAVVSAPLQVLRLVSDRLDPFVVAAFLADRENVRLAIGAPSSFVNVRDLEVPVFSLAETKALSQALEALGAYEQSTRDNLEAVAALKVRLTGGLTSGVIAIEPEG
jgi:hypothetical protein